MARQRIIQPGAKFGPYEIIGTSGSVWSVACSNCGTERRLTEKTLRTADSLKEKTCKDCEKTKGGAGSPAGQIKRLSARISSLERSLSRMRTVVDGLAHHKMIAKVHDLHSKLDGVDSRATAVRSKEVIYSEVFVFLGYMVSSGSIPPTKYIEQVGLLMQLVESVPAGWFHARRGKKLAEWVSFLNRSDVLSAIRGCEVDPIPELAEGDNDDDG